MNRKTMLTSLCAAAFVITSGMAFSADKDRKPGGMEGMQGMHGDKGMSCTMGESCPCMSGMKAGIEGGMMGGGAMTRGGAMPHLPSGNEKLELQMRAEMMQKMGEIMAKYAAQVK